MNVPIKQGDTAPALRHKLSVESDLAGSAATFTMSHYGKVIVDDGAATIEDGHAVYVWQDGDTDTVGVLRGEFTIRHPDGTRETDPKSGYIQITIERSLNMPDTTEPQPGDARGIVSAIYNEATGIVTFLYTDGTTSTTGDLRGKDGLPGVDGTDGEDGAPGADGQSATVTTFTDQAAFDAYVPAGPLDLAVLTNA